MAELKLEMQRGLVEDVVKNLQICGRTLLEWAQILSTRRVDGLWLCDPDKAESCPKTGCGKTGGECWLTTCEQWRADPPQTEGWDVLAVTVGEIFRVEQVSELRIRGADGLQMHRLEDGTITITKPAQ